jgi:hypothetical protein
MEMLVPGYHKRRHKHGVNFKESCRETAKGSGLYSATLSNAKERIEPNLLFIASVVNLYSSADIGSYLV